MFTHYKKKTKGKLSKSRVCVALGAIISISVMASSVSFAEKPFAGKTISALLLTDPYYYGLSPQIPKFEAETGIKVNIITVAAEHLRERALMDFIAGSGTFDIPFVDKPWMGEYMGAGMHFLALRGIRQVSFFITLNDLYALPQTL